jgi:hypothetical protein
MMVTDIQKIREILMTLVTNHLLMGQNDKMNGEHTDIIEIDVNYQITYRKKESEKS